MAAYQFEELSTGECLRLLRAGVVGWVAYPDDDGAALVPVNYVMHRDEMVIMTSYGSKLAAAAHSREMSFGVGDFDLPSRSGWSVVVRGPSRLVGDELVNPDLPPGDAWGVRGKGIPIAIELGHVSGRRVVAPGDAATPGPGLPGV